MKTVYCRLAEICAAAVAVPPLLVLLSWIIGEERIGAIGGNYKPMAPSTAGLMIVLGCAAFMLARRPSGKATRALTFLAMVSAVAMSLMVGSRVILGVTLPVECWLNLNPSTITVEDVAIGLMSPLTAIVFLLTALTLYLQSLALGGRRPYREITSVAASAALVISLAVLFSYMVGAPLLCSGIPMALLTAISFTLLSVGLLLAAGPDAWPLSFIGAGDRVSSPSRTRSLRRGSSLKLLGLFLSIGAIGFFIIRYQFNQSRRMAQEHLTAIADLKSREITDWYREHLMDARVSFNNPMTQAGARALLEDPRNTRLRRNMQGLMESALQQHSYHVVALYSADRNIRLIASTVDDQQVLTREEEITAALHARDVFVVDLHRDRNAAMPDSHPIHLCFWIPIFPESGRDEPALGAFLLQVDPSVFFYPLISTWPTPSRTAETILIRREEDDVVLLNELRRHQGTALTRFPIRTRPFLPAAMVAMGREGIVEGRDDHDIPVLADLRRIPGTPWFIVVKIDQEEVYAPLHEKVRDTGFLFLSMMCVAALSVGIMYRRREGQWLQTQLTAEQERHALAERFRSLFEQAAVGVAEIDNQTGRFLKINRRYCEIIGATAEEMLDTSLQAITHPDDLQATLDNMARLKAGEIREFIIEKRDLRKDGTVIWVNLTVSLLWGPGESPPHHLAIVHNITTSKQAEEALCQQLTRLSLLNRIARAVAERQQPDSMLRVVLQRLMDNLPAAAVFVLYYDQATDVFTVRQHNMHSEALAAEIGCPEGAKIPTEQMGVKVCLAGKTLYLRNTAEAESTFFQKMAVQGLWSGVVAPLVVDDRVVGIICVMRREVDGFESEEVDFVRQLSEHVALVLNQAQLHENLQTAYDEMRATQKIVLQQERLRVLGQMSSGIAHDINNSLSPIMMNIELMLMADPSLSDQSRGRLRTVMKATTDIANTVRRLREFYISREEGQLLHPVELNVIVKDTIDLTRPHWRDTPLKNGIVVKIATALQPRLPSILGIESELREALANLIINAVDAMPGGGTITIGTEIPGLGSGPAGEPEESSKVALWVRDTGSGMDEETRLHCLEPFYTNKGERGTGLGLAMVYGIVQRHNATLEIESDLGRGTTFRLIFPVPARAAESSVPTVVPTKHNVPHLRILCIDDESLLREALRQILEFDEHQVECRGDGRAGLEAFHAAKERGEPFQVVITDLGMPGLDGRQVALMVKRDSPGTHVILLTGWGEQMKFDEDIPEGVDLILSKPPKIVDLWQALAKVAGVPED